MRKGQLLTAKTKNRLKYCQKLLNKLKHHLQRNIIWFFSDKKNFCQDQVVNSQNNRWLAVCSKDVPKVIQTKFPATVMVFGVVSSEGHIMPPYIFPKGLMVNTLEYLKVLEMYLMLWICKVAAGRPYVRQQDSAPCVVVVWKGMHFRSDNKQDWGRGFILLLPQTVALPESDAGSGVAKPPSSFVIQNRQTSYSMWCPMYRAHC